MKKKLIALVVLFTLLFSETSFAADSWPQAPTPRGWNNLSQFDGIRIGQWLPCDPSYANTNDCIESIKIRKVDGSLSGTLKYLPDPNFNPLTAKQVWQVYENPTLGPIDNYPSFENQREPLFELPQGFVNSGGGKNILGHVALMSGGLQFRFVAENNKDESLPTDSILEITVKSSKIKSLAGWILGNIKDPNVRFHGGDLLTASGVPQLSPSPKSDCTKLELGNEEVAYSSAATFSLNVDTYNPGKTSGEVVMSTNGWWCFNGIDFDKTTRQLVAKIGTSHYDENKNVVEGWLELKIAGRIAREWWKLDPATAVGYAQVEVTYANGVSKLATVTARYNNAEDLIDLRAYGFHYSSPAVKMSINKPSSALKTTITCSKGKTSKKVTAVNPKCPNGYKKKAA